MQLIDNMRLSRIKPSFVTRRVDHDHIRLLETDATGLTSGDLVIAEVQSTGQHPRIERPDGRRAVLFSGDEVLLACGSRYAPDQFEARCPTAAGPAHLAAAGGIAGLVVGQHGQMKPATAITILGAVCDRSGQRINLSRYAVDPSTLPIRQPVVAVCGTSMNAGKTHTVASLARGLALNGHKVAAIKVTGTGAGGDLWLYRDSGAHHVSDFTDAGFASTAHVPVDDILDGIHGLIGEAIGAGNDVVVVELADGLLQHETAELLQNVTFQGLLSGLVFAARDAMGAQAGVAWLRQAGLPVRAVSGCLTQSPLAMREASEAIDLPCLDATDFHNPRTLSALVARSARSNTRAIVAA